MRELEITPKSASDSDEIRIAPEISLSGKRILAFGGAGSIGAMFVRAATAAGAEPVVAEHIPTEESARRQIMERLRALAGAVSGERGQSGRSESGRGEIGAAATSPGQHPSSGYPRFFQCDVTDLDDVEATVRAACDPGGRLDIVVDFAGVHHPPFELANDDPQELLQHFRRVIDVNLTGAFIVTAAAARAMIPKRHGHIIHLCSNGSRAALYGSYGYTASKHGVEGVVKTAAAQLARYGVRVNGIAPGTVETPLNQHLLRSEDGTPRPRAKSILAHTPTKRFATVEGVTESLLAMCVEQRHFTGNVLFADDGYNIEGHSWPEGNEALYAGTRQDLLNARRHQP